MSNINDTYFDGLYKDIWRSMIPAQLTVKEVDFMLHYFQLTAGDRVLDIMCGYGRHAIALARAGMKVTAVDNLEDYISEIRNTSVREALPLTPVQTDILQYRPEGLYRLAICMGNSLNFFNPEGIDRLLSTISIHLEKGGHLLINTWTLAEIAIRQFVEKSQATVDGNIFSTQSQYLFHPTRIETETAITTPDGTTEKKLAIDYILSISEMERALSKQGLVLKEVYSIPGKKKFSVGEPRAYIVAGKE